MHSRHPLWDQSQLHAGDEELERVVRGFSRWPLRWRAALIVRTSDARPQEIFRVAGPSLWPLIAAIGVVLIFLGELLKLRWGIPLAAVLVVVAVVGWNWPDEPPMTVDEEDAFEREYRVPVNAGGSVVVASWAMGVAILFTAVLFATLLLSYFYLRLENPVWPPAGFTGPGLAPTISASVLVIGGVAAMRRALQRVRAGDQTRFVQGLVASLVLATGGVVVAVVDLVRLEFEATTHAYGSIFYTLAGFMVTVVVGAMIMGAMALYWAIRGLYTSRRHAMVANVARFWMAAAVMWVVGFGTLYLGPQLT